MAAVSIRLLWLHHEQVVTIVVEIRRLGGQGEENGTAWHGRGMAWAWHGMAWHRVHHDPSFPVHGIPVIRMLPLTCAV